VLDVQLLGQVCGPAEYAAWKAARETAWRKQRASWSTAQWPDAIESDGYAALLLPISAGRVGVAVAKHPRAIASPIFTSGAPGRHGGDYTDLVLGLVVRWLGNPGEGVTTRLAPPVIELVGRRGVLKRRVEAFGQEWPLPHPDGV
jgi:hypothetical protein